MAREFEITPNKTYATHANAVKAVEKKYPEAANDGLRYFTMRTAEGRFFPVFVGMECVQRGVHFHFNVVA